MILLSVTSYNGDGDDHSLEYLMLLAKMVQCSEGDRVGDFATNVEHEWIIESVLVRTPAVSDMT